MNAPSEVFSVSDEVRPCLELKGASKTFGRVIALDRVDFAVWPNEIVGLLGENGAGKSTLVKVLSGILLADAGTVLRDGQPARLRSHADAERLGIETIYQDTALVNTLSVYRNMFLGREETNALGFLRRRAMKAKTIEILKNLVKISGIDSGDQIVGALSGGQRQAVAIARAVHFRKKMLLLDEPTSALSVRETENLLNHLLALKVAGVSCVLVTHNLYHAFRVCDRFVVLARGRKLIDAPKGKTSLEQLTAAIVNG